MRNLLILFSCALIFAACAGSKTIELNSLTQLPFKGQITLQNPSEFNGETVSNLVVYQKENILYATMDVRAYCNARITFGIEKKADQLRLKLENSSGEKDNCVGITNVTTSLKNVEPGSYEVMVLNSSGNQLLATKRITVK